MVVIRGAGIANSLEARGVIRVYYMYYIIKLVVSSLSVEGHRWCYGYRARIECGRSWARALVVSKQRI